MLKTILKSTFVTALALLAACASIIEGSKDHVSIATSPPVNANCTMVNARGKYTTYGTAPAVVKKSKSDLNVNCVDRKSGLRGKTILESDVEPWVFGNVIIGGLIGLGIDWGTGAAYDYPDRVIVSMLSAKAFKQSIHAPVPVAVKAAEFATSTPPAITEPVIQVAAPAEQPNAIIHPPEPQPQATVSAAPAVVVATAAIAEAQPTPKGVAFDFTKIDYRDTPPKAKPVKKAIKKVAASKKSTSSKTGCRASLRRCPASVQAKHRARRSSHRG